MGRKLSKENLYVLRLIRKLGEKGQGGCQFTLQWSGFWWSKVGDG